MIEKLFEGFYEEATLCVLILQIPHFCWRVFPQVWKQKKFLTNNLLRYYICILRLTGISIMSFNTYSLKLHLETKHIIVAFIVSSHKLLQTSNLLLARSLSGVPFLYSCTNSRPKTLLLILPKISNIWNKSYWHNF